MKGFIKDEIPSRWDKNQMTYEWYSPPMGYDEIVATQGEIIKDWNLGDYQGDYMYLLKKDDKYAFVVIGYGSCSGCDALEACENDEEFNELKEDIIRDIIWKTKEDLYDYITNKNANRWYYHEHEWKTIKRELKAELRRS